MLGAATSTLAFFRQVGGSIGLALSGTIFGSNLPAQLQGAGVPQPIVGRLRRPRSGSVELRHDRGGRRPRGSDPGGLPEQARPQVEPFIPAIIDGIHQAFSLAIGNALWLGVAASALAAVILLVALPEIQSRTWRSPPATE